jgi:hypothetical protein
MPDTLLIIFIRLLKNCFCGARYLIPVKIQRTNLCLKLSEPFCRPRSVERSGAECGRQYGVNRELRFGLRQLCPRADTRLLAGGEAGSLILKFLNLINR